MLAASLEVNKIEKEKLLDIINIQTEVVQEGINLSKIMFLVARRSQDVIGGDGAVIELREQDQMVYRATSGLADPQLGLRLPLKGSLSGLCIQEGRPLNCSDSESDSRVDKKACRRVGLRSMIVTPLIHNGETIGVLKVMSRELHQFEDREIQILELLSQLISAAMYTAEKYSQDELYLKATTDSMTGIRNRSMFYDLLRLVHSRAEHSGESFGILVLDMDGLKKINDTFGHKAGDAGILEVVRRINKTLREPDVFCRLGGDEFGILLENVKNLQQLQTLKERIHRAVNKPYQFEGNILDLGVSLGFALAQGAKEDINALIEQADNGMYLDKRSKKTAPAVREDPRKA